MAQVIRELTPRVNGDLSAGHTAILGSLPSHVDEVLMAENSFLRCADAERISSRIMAMAKNHVSKHFTEGGVPTTGSNSNLQ